jgi:hypothetical protein
MRRSRWGAAFGFLAPWVAALFAGGVLDYFLIPAVIIAAIAVAGQRVHRRGESVRDVVLQWRQLARDRVDSAAKLRAEAPLAAGLAASVSILAVSLTLATVPFSGRGVYLPPAADARWQLWCIAIAAVGAVIAVDCWFGLGTCVRALATDGVTASFIAVTIALAATSPLMIFWQVGSRPAWLALIAAQFLWIFGGVFLGAAVCGRRRRRLSPSPSPRSPANWLAEYGIDANRDVVLVSPGSRKVLVIMAIRTLTGVGLREAKDLVDNAPGFVMRHVTSGQADRAREMLESLGAIVTVTGDPGEA